MPLQIFAPKKPKQPEIRDKESVESERTPADWVESPPILTEREKRLVALVEDRFRQAADARRVHEGTWFEGLAFYLGNQWVEWSNSRATLKSLRDPNNPYKIYTSHNKVQPKIDKLLARILHSKPDASVVPLTGTDQDKAASKEARSVLAHLDRLFDRQSQTKQLMRYGLTTTTAFLKIYFDPQKVVDVPKYDAQGTMIGSTRSDVGEMCEDIVPFTEVYPDPKVKTWGELSNSWLIHAKLRSLDYIQQHYENGKWVQGEATGGIAGIVETRLASVVGDYQRTGTETGKNAAIVKEMWDRNPTSYTDADGHVRDFPNGRLVTIANGVLLREQEWPFEFWDEMNFIPFEYKAGLGSAWGLNATSGLLSPQRDYNRTLSRIQQHVRTSWGKILASTQSNIGPNAFNSAREGEIIYYDIGSPPPIHLPPPALPPFLMQCLQLDDADMQDISGIHDVSNGSVPAGVTAGNAIELLQESDQTQMADAQGNVEASNVKRAECELALVRQYYTEPRLIALQDVKADSPDAAAAEAMTFTNLARGRVVVLAGSSTAKSPAARIQQIMDMAGKGMFQMEALPTTIMLLDQMGLERSDDLVDRLKQALVFMLKMAQANQPNPQAIAEQQAQAKAQLQQEQQAHEATLEAARAHEMQLAGQIKMAENAAAAQQKIEHDTTIKATEHAHEIELAQVEARIEIEKQRALRALPPQIGPISVSADPAATVDAERMAGLEGEEPPEPTTTPSKPM